MHKSDGLDDPKRLWMFCFKTSWHKNLFFFSRYLCWYNSIHKSWTKYIMMKTNVYVEGFVSETR